MALDVTKHTRERFAVGIYLDHLWCQTMRLPIDDKESVLATVLDVLLLTCMAPAGVDSFLHVALEDVWSIASLDPTLRPSITRNCNECHDSKR
jgi:hypothetical protein